MVIVLFILLFLILYPPFNLPNLSGEGSPLISTMHAGVLHHGKMFYTSRGITITKTIFITIKTQKPATNMTSIVFDKEWLRRCIEDGSIRFYSFDDFIDSVCI